MSKAIRFQFSIRLLLVATAAVAAIAFAFSANDSTWCGAILLILIVTIPSYLAMGCVYGRGWLRAFCVAAVVPASFGYAGVGEDLSYLTRISRNTAGIAGYAAYAAMHRNYLGTVWLFALLVGLSAVLVYAFLGIDDSPERPPENER